MSSNIDRHSTRRGSTIPRGSYTASITSESSIYPQDQPPQQNPSQHTSPEAGPSTPYNRPSSTISSQTLVATPALISEQYWTPAHEQSGGHRTEVKYPRGVRTLAGTLENQWLRTLELPENLDYKFLNPALLEEALESPGSGVVVVGDSNRRCPEGNTGLARVGLSVMKLVLRDQCYLFNILESKCSAMWQSFYGGVSSRSLDWMDNSANQEK